GLLILILFGVGYFFKYNDTPSMKLGWYFLNRFEEPEKHDLVLFPAPEKAYKVFPNLRGFLPRRTLLLKQIIAVDGDQVCTDENSVSVNGHRIEHPLLPQWQSFASMECIIVPDNNVFVIGQSPDSLDSRFYGAISTSSIVSKGDYLGTFF
ncbi:signal peptidase I, partial [Idiomarina sp. UBA1919]|uniref:signal peptidase I n=1 Tax=Idiomarina sp. UBA1919 TaxID=1946640 RepID=UPI00257F57AD